MKKILIVDTVCPKPYDTITIRQGGFGGTEQTAMYLAEALHNDGGYEVTIDQHNRSVDTVIENINYNKLRDFSAAIVLRNPLEAYYLKKLNPNKTVWLWLHDLTHPGFGEAAPLLARMGVGVIVVSDYHKHNVIEALRLNRDAAEYPRIRRIYNPMHDVLWNGQQQVDKHKLTFMSSPHKGLKYTLKVFEMLHRVHPEYTLHVANPGYYPDANLNQPGVVALGQLSLNDTLRHVSESLCLFYPNHEYPETFGLILAQSNMVGTPVITHDLGASREVLKDSNQLVDTKDPYAVINKVLAWNKERPIVKAREEFKMHNVIKSWKEIL